MQCGKVININALTGYNNHKSETFFSGSLDNFYKSKKCIKIDYRLGSKRSKFDLTLISVSPFNLKIDLLPNLIIFNFLLSFYMVIPKTLKMVTW